MIVHIVMFKFKEQNRDANIEEVVKRLNALVELIPTLKSMEVGVDFSRTERAFDMSLYSTFDTKEDLQDYAVHPEHLKVVELIKSVTLESKVVDYVL
ncbi:Dabb family protein [Candidatus Sulfurimonas marisnigri]|uniref:Dabb family protein n=1 Tax=Candidatus Sulfurimonas marisnigri TaxID=2740405 RepID=A0A7S7RPY4_9BACT|nr:Dabb family protein [Candidatus Sulfurimonas marisnigri]QOY53895.1 Dabb family protein [Candidatus Sulfurimonas marisnigri]